eukprot:10803392-Alexandrium_andersonii.AAC.1
MGQPRASCFRAHSHVVEQVHARASTHDPRAAHRLRAALVACAPSRQWAPVRHCPGEEVATGTSAAVCW